MPPMQRFNKEDVLNTAFQLVREQGIENLNAKNIAKMLNSSTQPIYSYYENMADLKADLFNMVCECHNRCFDKVEPGKNLFVNIGMAYIDFAIDEPNLFRMMFMAQGFSGKKLTDFCTDDDDDCNESLRNMIFRQYDFSSTDVNRIFLDIWLYAHGIASMLALNQLPTPRSEIEAMLENMYNLLLKQVKKKSILTTNQTNAHKQEGKRRKRK